jgi:hypothetical protein
MNRSPGKRRETMERSDFAQGQLHNIRLGDFCLEVLREGDWVESESGRGCKKGKGK